MYYVMKTGLAINTRPVLAKSVLLFESNGDEEFREVSPTAKECFVQKSDF